MIPSRLQCGAWVLLGALSMLAVAAPTGGSEDQALLVFPDGFQVELGAIPAGERTVSVPILNPGSAVIEVESIEGSCTCMDLDLAQEALMPGQRAKLDVKLNVQPGIRQSGAIFVQTRDPHSAKYAVFLSYEGRQVDRFELVHAPDLVHLEPDEVLEFQLECEWSTDANLGPNPVVNWRVRDCEGLRLKGTELRTMGEGHFLSIANFVAEAGGRDAVTGRIEVEAGEPSRAQLARRIEIPVRPSVEVIPSCLLVPDVGGRSGDSLGSAQLVLATGWEVESIDAPKWARVEETPGGIEVFLVKPPALRRGVARIQLNCVAEDGASATRTLRLVLDSGENDA